MKGLFLLTNYVCNGTVLFNIFHALNIIIALLFFSFLPETWDCVVTCYFIDTAHNVIAYIENISKILKPGGYWINLGTLTVHSTCKKKKCKTHTFPYTSFEEYVVIFWTSWKKLTVH